MTAEPAANDAPAARRRPLLAGVAMALATAWLALAAVAGVPAVADPLAHARPLVADGASEVPAVSVVVGVGGGGQATGVRVSESSLVSGASSRAVTGVTGQRVYAQVHGNVVAARWSYAPGPHVVNDRIDAWLRDQFAQHAALAGLTWPAGPVEGAPPGGMGDDRGCVPGGSVRPVAEVLADRSEVPEPGADGSALVIGCDIVLARGSMFGIRMRASEVRYVAGEPMLVHERVQTFVADLSNDTSATADELVTPQARTRLAALVRGLAAAAQGTPLSTGPLGQRVHDGLDAAALLSDVVPLDDGGLLVRLASGTFEATGEAPVVPLEVRLAPTQVQGALTPAGEAAARAAAQRLPWAGTPQPPGAERTPCDLVPCIALTFDDGPGPDTAAVLDALHAHGAGGSFFVVGQQVAEHPDLAARIAAEGHTIGNHTYNHVLFSVTPFGRIQQQLGLTDGAVRAVTGAAPTYLRPPWGVFNGADPRGYARPIVLWTYDSKDWRDPSAAALHARLNRGAAPGAIVLMHDTHAVTAEAMPMILAGLEARGYRLVTLEELVGPRPVGSVTTHGPGFPAAP